jgi:hypothetical protein
MSSKDNEHDDQREHKLAAPRPFERKVVLKLPPCASNRQPDDSKQSHTTALR